MLSMFHFMFYVLRKCLLTKVILKGININLKFYVRFFFIANLQKGKKSSVRHSVTFT